MSTQRDKNAKSLLGIGIIVGLAIAMFVLFIAALATALRFLIVCVVPGVIYVATRLLLGASPLPTSSIGYPFSENSRLGLAIMVLFLAFLSGLWLTFLVFTFAGCILLPFSILEAVFHVKAVPGWFRFIYSWPLVALPFASGVALQAIEDVKTERKSK